MKCKLHVNFKKGILEENKSTDIKKKLNINIHSLFLPSILRGRVLNCSSSSQGYFLFYYYFKKYTLIRTMEAMVRI